MKTFLILFTLVFSVSGFCTSKAEVKMALEQMKQTGMFTPEQIAEAEKRLNAMSDEEMKALAAEGQKKAQDPEIQKKMREMANDPAMKEKLQNKQLPYYRQSIRVSSIRCLSSASAC